MNVLLISLYLFALTLPQSEPPIRVVNFRVTDCNETILNPEQIQWRIVEKKFKRNLFVIKVATTETCCLLFEPISKYYSSPAKGTDTLYLDYIAKGTACECDCYYEFTYEIKGIKHSNFVVKFNDELITTSNEKFKTYPVRFKMLGSDTINFLDKRGFQQGVWIHDTTNILKYHVLKDDMWIEEVELYPNGKYKRLRKRSGPPLIVEYFESGAKKLECRGGETFKTWQCKEWNEKGELISEDIREIR